MKLDVRTFLVKNRTSKVVAMASISFDGVFVVDSIRVVEGKNGLFVSFPQIKNKDDKYNDVAYPCTKEAYKYICNKIIEDYNKNNKSKQDKDGFIPVNENDSGLPFD